VRFCCWSISTRPAPRSSFSTRGPWNPRVGSHLALGVDGVSLPMVLLATVLCFVAIFSSTGIRSGAKLYFSLLLVLETSLLIVFTARDWSLFYVCWELTLIPLFFLIDRLGEPIVTGQRSISSCTRSAARCSC
jgi:NADH:ubiquinone oxidoreductase subunit 4 (subunit M)